MHNEKRKLNYHLSYIKLASIKIEAEKHKVEVKITATNHTFRSMTCEGFDSEIFPILSHQALTEVEEKCTTTNSYSRHHRSSPSDVTHMKNIKKEKENIC